MIALPLKPGDLFERRVRVYFDGVASFTFSITVSELFVEKIGALIGF